VSVVLRVRRNPGLELGTVMMVKEVAEQQRRALGVTGASRRRGRQGR